MLRQRLELHFTPRVLGQRMAQDWIWEYRHTLWPAIRNATPKAAARLIADKAESSWPYAGLEHKHKTAWIRGYVGAMAAHYKVGWKAGREP